MEADSTTYDNATQIENSQRKVSFPFAISPQNFTVYQSITSCSPDGFVNSQIIEKLQSFGLMPTEVKCPSSKSDCNVVCRTARVIDRVQWICQTCGKRQPIRIGTFFLNMRCSIQQVLQIALAWSEDVDVNVASKYFDVKPKVAACIYDRLDELAIKELNKLKLGGVDCVVLTEMYPDCLNCLSPDTTDQPHVHRILMVADTKHVPTYYRLHVITGDPKNLETGYDANQILKSEVENVLGNVTDSRSMVVLGNNVPNIEGCTTYQHLVRHFEGDMQHFLSSRVWRQALSLCAASRDLCGENFAACATSVQRYLDTSLYRLRYGDGFYEHALRIMGADCKV